MTALQEAIARLKKEKIRFLMVPATGYIMPAVRLLYREEYDPQPYNFEDFEETGKPLCGGVGSDNPNYCKPKEQDGYKLDEFLMTPPERKKVMEDLFKWWNDYGGKLPQKQYEILGDILERLIEEPKPKRNKK